VEIYDQISVKPPEVPAARAAFSSTVRVIMELRSAWKVSVAISIFAANEMSC
jgi:hypothetical protein